MRNRETRAHPACARDRSPSGIAAMRHADRLLAPNSGRHESGGQAASDRHTKRHRQDTHIQRDRENRSRRDGG